jgi:hypothetical protein
MCIPGISIHFFTSLIRAFFPLLGGGGVEMCEGLTAWGPPSIRGFMSSVQLRDLLGFIYINHQGYWGGGGGG